MLRDEDDTVSVLSSLAGQKGKMLFKLMLYSLSSQLTSWLYRLEPAVSYCFNVAELLSP